MTTHEPNNVPWCRTGSPSMPWSVPIRAVGHYWPGAALLFYAPTKVEATRRAQLSVDGLNALGTGLRFTIGEPELA